MCLKIPNPKDPGNSESRFCDFCNEILPENSVPVEGELEKIFLT